MKVKSAPFHPEWYQALGDRAIQYLLLESGRGNAKTTIGSVEFSLYNICESDDEEMQVASRASGATGTATKIMAKVKRELEENTLLISDYGIQRGKEWGKEHIQVIRGDGHRIDFYSVGKHSSIRGSRGTVLIDDPQNEADCRSETILEADDAWLLSDVLPIIIHDQRLVVMATPISVLSLCSKIKRMPMFKVLSFPVENPPGSGKSAWPEQYSDEFLAERKAVMGFDRYAAEYLCQPRVPGTPVFRSEWFKSYDPTDRQFDEDKRNSLYTCVGMDCAESKADQADYTALVTLAATPGKEPRIYCLDARKGHWTTKEGAEQPFQLLREYQQHWTGVETRVKDNTDQTGGDAMIREIRERQSTYGQHVNLHPIRPVHDKVTRAMHVQSLCQQGLVRFNMQDKGQQWLLDELTMFTGDQNYHDDLVDAFVYALTEIKDRSSRGAETVKAVCVTPCGARRHSVTGILG
jgi:predicted phage terminase large subunit-like protein